ncbi:hypothetical protein KUTeg_013060 [Tegillarca granosa]|uniref:Uncharacterized protein n=1 Tax=Tegillarca granosa TaxID=220873 RepID=A0ABQ9EW41_TEGGR|nr:hypothetical protein KUTeg_013060 [Tegillarca granosa]
MYLIQCVNNKIHKDYIKNEFSIFITYLFASNSCCEAKKLGFSFQMLAVDKKDYHISLKTYYLKISCLHSQSYYFSQKDITVMITPSQR